MKSWIAVALALSLFAAGCARKAPTGRSEVEDLQRSPEEWLREESIRLLRDYIRIDTRPEKGEKAGAEFLRQILSCEGIETELVCPAPGRCNVLARIPGRRRDDALLLLNHIDVVDAFPQYWQEAPPFEGLIKRGFLYGRGSYDMKSLGLAQALAMRNLKRRGLVPESDILFLAEADEEIGQRWGARWLLDHRPEWFAGVGQVLNEGGTTEVILRSVRFWGLETLQAGYAVLEVEAASEVPLQALAARWPKLSATPVAPHPHVVQGFDMLANHLLSPLTDPLRHLDRVRRDPRELSILPERYACFLEPRLNWSLVYHHPAFPDRARRFVSVCAPPGVSPRPYLEPILQDAKREGLTILTLVQSEATVASPYPTPFTELLKRVVEARYPGVPFGPLPTSGGYTTSILLRERGIPAYGFQAIPMNFTDASRRHGNDERVFLRDYLDGVALFSDVVEEFAQHSPPPTSVRHNPQS
jgi:acetylornithine deacetylase/succinyl-diaminopimelate desuccinylase-like protein